MQRPVGRTFEHRAGIAARERDQGRLGAGVEPSAFLQQFGQGGPQGRVARGERELAFGVTGAADVGTRDAAGPERPATRGDRTLRTAGRRPR
jgi:hypothetical protein